MTNSIAVILSGLSWIDWIVIKLYKHSQYAMSFQKAIKFEVMPPMQLRSHCETILEK